MLLCFLIKERGIQIRKPFVKTAVGKWTFEILKGEGKSLVKNMSHSIENQFHLLIPSVLRIEKRHIKSNT